MGGGGGTILIKFFYFEATTCHLTIIREYDSLEGCMSMGIQVNKEYGTVNRKCYFKVPMKPIIKMFNYLLLAKLTSIKRAV
jgi:hypothetical protein